MLSDNGMFGYKSKAPFHQRHGFNNRPNWRPQNNNFTNKDSCEHWCETCDRGFRSAEHLDSHISEHQKCGIDGCKFVAHPNVVTKHIQMQHSTGLYSKIRNIETPEDIAKWINERKKNYPTKLNAERKTSQIRESNDRGEKIRENKSRFNNRNNESFKKRRRNGPDRRRTHNFNKGNNNPLSVHNRSAPVEKIQPKELNNEEPVNEPPYCGLNAFKGISEMIRNDLVSQNETLTSEEQLDIEDNEWIETEKVDCLNDDKINCSSALSSLFDAYKSSSEDEVESNQQTVKESVTDGDDAPEETAIKRIDHTPWLGNELNKPEIIEDKEKAFKNRKRQFETKNSNIKANESLKRQKPTLEKQLRYYRDRPSTLLEKLLEKEIKHERNVILQCINYIVKNDFFDE